MAEELPPDPLTAPDIRGQAAQTAAGLLDVAKLVEIQKWVGVMGHDLLVDVFTFLLKYGAKLGAELGTILAEAENGAGPEFAKLASVAVQDLFGVSAGVTPGSGGRGGRQDVANQVGDMLFRAFSGAAAGGASPSGELQPTEAPAKAFLSTMTQLSLEGWLEGWIMEALSLGQLETFGELDDKISHTLGLGRAAAAVHGPLVKHMIVTPLDWKILKDVRPTLLTPSLAVKMFLAGKWTRDQLDEELARHGFAPKRIDALLFDARRELSTAEITSMISDGLLDGEAALPYLRALGYDDDQARVWSNNDRFRRERAYRDNIVPLAVRAYAARDIDGVELQQALDYALPNTDENNAARAHAEYARAYTVKRLSHAEVKDAVTRGILAVPDYRRWLEREGYADDDALVLELLLEATIRGQQEAAKKKADAEKQRLEEKAARDAERKKRQQELDAKKARTFAPLGDIERAVVLGILPMSAYTGELARLKFSGDDIAFEAELLQERRDAYLAALQKKTAAEGAPTEKTIALAQLERAVVLGVTSIETYRARLVADNYAADDAAIMVQLVADARADRERAEQLKKDAAAKLASKGLSLAQTEKAVRQGLLSLDDYAAWLTDQGFEAHAVALLRALLQQDMQHADDAAAVRATVTADAATKGVSLAQLERAVKLGVRTRDDYQAKLVALNVTPDDQVTLLGLLDAELAALVDAKAKRDAPPPAAAPPGLTRADMEKAVRAGVVTIGAYRDYLAAAGYADADVEVLASLLTLETQDVALARQRRDQVDAGNPTRQLARADIERAVKLGARTVGDYKSFISGAGYDADDQQLLVDVLEAELAAHDTARQRHDKIAAQLAPAGVDVAALDAAAIAGTLSLDGYVAQLGAAGVKPADVALLVQLIIEQSSEGSG